MYQGFYNLTSEMLTQTRNMNVIGNNMANVTTPGFKNDQFVASAFREQMMARYNGVNDVTPGGIGTIQMVRCADTTVTDYAVSAFKESTSPLDFAIVDSGFFCIQTENNGTVYTRDGSFTLDDEGYLTLPMVGRVLGTDGPIQFTSDDIIADNHGNIYTAGYGELIGTLSVVDFEDYNEQLFKYDNNVFLADTPGTPVDTQVRWKAVERSNVDAAKEMTKMMSGQRSLQSASQMLKIYDSLIEKTVNQLGPT